MNIGNVLFSPNGRIGQQDYWIGVLIIIGGNIVAGVLPIIGTLIALGLIWVGISVYGKRLHDAGKSAWLHVIPWTASIVLFIIGTFMVVGGAISAGLMSNGDDLSPEQIMTLVSAGGAGLAVMGLSTLVWIAYTIWVGVLAGEPTDNAFGSVPGADAAPAPQAPAGGPGPSEG
jgi:uncharacterized membrane protein YhaH (DUF805 family)